MVESVSNDTGKIQNIEESKVARPEEPISETEVRHLGEQLKKNKDDPSNALKLLKMLDGKRITAELLIETKIGKALTAVNDKTKEGLDQEQLKEVTRMKEHLKNKWKQVHALYKSKQKEKLQVLE